MNVQIQTIKTTGQTVSLLLLFGLFTFLPVSAQEVSAGQSVMQPSDHPSPKSPDRPIDRPEELRILDTYFRLAVEQNPELKSLKKGVEAQQERSPQVRALPDPEISTGYYLNPPGDTNFLSRFSVSAMQRFPWFGTLERRAAVEDALGEVMGHEVSSRQLEIFSDIQELWFTYYKLTHHIHVNMEIREIVRQLERLVEVRYETGQGGQADLLRLQMKEERLSNMIEDLEDEKNPVRERFNSLLERDSSEEISVPLQLPERELAWSREELHEFARRYHPEFNLLEAQRSRYRAEEELARLEGRPSFAVGVEYMGSDFGMMGMMDLDPLFIGMATVQVPLFRSRYRAQQREAQAQLRATDARESHLANRFRTDLEEAMKTLRNGQREYRLITEELLPRAEQIFDLLSEEYRTGQARFDELLDVVRELMALENEKIEALATQNQAMADLEELIANTEYNTGTLIPTTINQSTEP